MEMKVSKTTFLQEPNIAKTFLTNNTFSKELIVKLLLRLYIVRSFEGISF